MRLTLIVFTTFSGMEKCKKIILPKSWEYMMVYTLCTSSRRRKYVWSYIHIITLNIIMWDKQVGYISLNPSLASKGVNRDIPCVHLILDAFLPWSIGMDSLFCDQSGKNDMNTLYHLQNVPLVLIPLLVLRNKIWVFTQRSTTIVSVEIYSRKHKNRRSIFEQQQQQLRPNLSGGINCFFSLILALLCL